MTETILDLGGTNNSVAPEPPPRSLFPSRRAWLIAIFFVAPLILMLLFYVSTGYGYSRLTPRYIQSHTLTVHELSALPDNSTPMSTKEASRILERVSPKGVFVIIDRVQNRLHLRDGDSHILDAVISAGAGSELDDPSGKRHWVFDTPVGRFYVKGKRENPTWTAPDWDYIESGEPLPKHYSDRVQEGMLGEYALDLGGGPPGYMIHGTLYTRLLGRNVSHGCIRVGREDLRIVWKKVPVGSSVFMY
jgi:L,D-transpeptidase YbiS